MHEEHRGNLEGTYMSQNAPRIGVYATSVEKDTFLHLGVHVRDEAGYGKVVKTHDGHTRSAETIKGGRS